MYSVDYVTVFCGTTTATPSSAITIKNTTAADSKTEYGFITSATAKLLANSLAANQLKALQPQGPPNIYTALQLRTGFLKRESLFKTEKFMSKRYKKIKNWLEIIYDF